MIEIEKVDHLGIRVMDADRAVAFYALLGFGDPYKVPDDAVTIIRNKHGVEINLITNGSNNNSGKNILMDVTDKFPGYTHVALRVTSVAETIKTLEEHNIAITGGPVELGAGNLSIFVRDPDRNVIELRGRGGEKLTKDQYRPQ